MYFIIPFLLLCMLFPSCAQEDETKSATRIYGISASGNPIEGTVSVRGASGKTADCTTNSNGFFSVNVSSLTAPFLLSSKGSVNNVDVHYYSYASTYGRVNISQLTHAAVSMAIQSDASQYYADFPDANLPDANDINNYASGINLLLSDSYKEVGLEEDFDFLHDDFSTNGTGFDLILDRISLTISISDLTVFLSEKDTHIPIFVHDINKDQNIYFLDPEHVSEILVLEHCYPFFQNLSVGNIMNDIYFWNKFLPESFNAEDYKDPESVLNALRYEKDRWSYIVSKDTFDSYMKDSAYVGLGFYMARDIFSDLRVSFVYPDSPADNNGLSRGDIILEINHVPSDKISSQTDSAFGDDKPGEAVLIKVQKHDDTTVTLNLIKQELTISSVLHSTILDINEESLGYLVFNNFVTASVDELEPVFKHFKDNEISELILDLRYNSGGLMNIAQHLASLIGGRNLAYNTFCKVQFNEDSAYMNRTYEFVELENSLEIKRLIVITSVRTCSASEALINGLKPYMDVVVIGSPTCGKPVGMNPFNVCDKYLLPVTHQVVNSLGEGEYFDGIISDCFAFDDLTRPFGDIDENSLSEALYYIENKHCSYQKRHREIIESYPFPMHGFRHEIGAF